MTARHGITPAARERQRIAGLLAAASGLAWLLLVLGGTGIALPAICSASLLWSVPTLRAFGFFFASVPPWTLAAGWLVMVAAMMLPTVCGPLTHVRQRCLSRHRPACLALFLAGYLGVWALAGGLLLAVVVTLRMAGPDPAAALAIALAAAIVWQVSPWKQVALNRCHRRPSLAAFAPAAYRSALAFGLRFGAWCVASCWPLMAVALLVPAQHIAVMVVLAACIWAERLEPARPPKWWPGLPTRTLRTLAWLAARLRHGHALPRGARGAFPNRRAPGGVADASD